MSKKISPRALLIIVLALLAATNLVVLLDVPLMRPLLGFFFLLLIPGVLVLHILGLTRVDGTTRVVLAAGTSIAFAMFFGAAVSGLLTAVGYDRPLSTLPLLLGYDVAVFALAAVAYAKRRDPGFSWSTLRLTLAEKAFLAIPALFPIMSIAGMRLMNANSNNVVLVLLLLSIALYMIAIGATRRHVPPRVYPVAILLIGVSLLLMYSLRSNHIIGSDTHRELFIFQTTLENGRWSRVGFETLDTVLAISILPAVFQTVTGVEPEFTFKLLYSFIFSFAPLVVFLLSRRYLSDKQAFFAAAFFMSQVVFLWTPAYARVSVATLFFGLALLVLFHPGIAELGRRLLFVLFLAGMITSHYATTYIVFIMLVLTWLICLLAARTRLLGSLRTKISAGKRAVGATAIGLFAIMIFLWYGQVTGPTFSIGVRFISQSLLGWRTEMRESVVDAALGQTFSAISLPQRIEFVFSWLMILLIGVGVLACMANYWRRSRRSSAAPNPKFETEYLAMSGVACALLVVTMVLPYVSRYYGAARVFYLMMIVLSVFCPLGAGAMAGWLRRRASSAIVLAVLVPYFLSVTGVIGLPFGHYRQLTLSSEGPLYETMFIHDQDSLAAEWLSRGMVGLETVYANDFSGSILVSQGGIPGARINQNLVADYKAGKGLTETIYLRQGDRAYGQLEEKYPDLFARKSRIYDTGAARIYG